MLTLGSFKSEDGFHEVCKPILLRAWGVFELDLRNHSEQLPKLNRSAVQDVLRYEYICVTDSVCSELPNFPFAIVHQLFFRYVRIFLTTTTVLC